MNNTVQMKQFNTNIVFNLATPNASSVMRKNGMYVQKNILKIKNLHLESP